MSHEYHDNVKKSLAKRRILLVDYHPLVRRGLTALIDSEQDLSICAAVTMPREVLAAIVCFRPLCEVRNYVKLGTALIVSP